MRACGRPATVSSSTAERDAVNEREDRQRTVPTHGVLVRGADRAVGWFFYLVVGSLVMMLGAALGFIACLYLIMAFWLGEQPLAIAPAELSWAGAVAGAVVAGLAYLLMFRRRR